MKIPKSFIPEKDKKNNLRRLLEQKQNEDTVRALLASCEEFSRKIKDENHGHYPETWYEEVGIVLANSIEYTKYDLEALGKRIMMRKEQERNIGCYISALVNKIITEETIITMNFNKSFDNLGMLLQKGKLVLRGQVGDNVGYCMQDGMMVVEGSVGSHAGHRMDSGEIIIEGDAESHLGFYMFGGKIQLEGNAGDYTGMVMHKGEIIINGDVTGKNMGYSMKKGAKITVNGRIKHPSFVYCEGEIYNNGVNLVINPYFSCF